MKAKLTLVGILILVIVAVALWLRFGGVTN